LDKFYEVSDAVGDVVGDIVDFKTETTVSITNILSITEIDNIPSLEAIAAGLGLEQTEYEPEQFPALIYRREDAVLLIFSSGKIVCTGSTDLDQISSAINGTTKQIDALAV
jgi:transcription initiation factor TFIID TATA-box-binding protein